MIKHFWMARGWCVLSAILFLLTGVSQGADAEKKAKDFKGSQAKETSTNDPVYLDYMKVLTLDDTTEKEVDQLIKEAQAFEDAGDTTAMVTIKGKVRQRLDVVKDAYKNFLSKYPNHAEGRLAYGSFLMDIREEEEAVVQMEKAKDIDPKNPAAWNNLANHYGHRGPVKKAFEYYAKAMELDPKESTYPWNLATTTYLFRVDAREFYNIDEQEVFNRAMTLYSAALKLDPTNLVLATDLAQSYYGIKPMRTNDALLAWTNALALAKTSDEQQGIFLHLARVELNTGRFEEARRHLALVTNKEMLELKERLERNVREKEFKATNIVAASETAAPVVEVKPLN